MRRNHPVFSGFFLGMCLLMATTVLAQRSKDDDFFGISLRGALPAEQLGDYRFGFGAMLMDEYVLNKTFSLAAEIGLWQFSAKSNRPGLSIETTLSSIRIITLLGGVKYYFGDFYLMASAGVLYSSFVSTLMGEDVFNNRGGLGLQPAIGYHYGIIDVALEYTRKISGDPPVSWVGFRVGVYLLDFHF